MKRMLAAGFITAIAVVGSAGAATAAPAGPGADAACFGQVHKAVNDGFVDGIDNVGRLVQAFEGGQNKNATAKTFC